MHNKGQLRKGHNALNVINLNRLLFGRRKRRAKSLQHIFIRWALQTVCEIAERLGDRKV